MIDEKVLIERLGEQKSDWNYDYNVPINDAIEIVNKLAEESNLTPCYLGSPCEYQNEEAKMPPTLLDYITFVDDNNGWIPCSERLPEVENDYIVCFARGYITISTFSKGMFWYVGDEIQPIAWMPLPAPYKEDKND